MYYSSRIASLLLVIIFIQFISCNKSSDYSSSLTTSVQSNATIDLSACKIRRVWQEGPTRVTGLFTYNSKGNPISLIYDNNGTLNPNHYFLYDNLGRLKEWRLTFNNGTFVRTRHRYKYNASNVIIADTAWYVEGDSIVDVSTFVYDAQGRIVKETIQNIYNSSGSPLSPTRNPTFTYDSRGNLAVAGWKSSWYDYKINPLRINPLFQFLMRNYSQNNPIAQPKYNSKGLPLSLNPSNDEFFNSRITYVIVYDCP